MQKPHQKGLKWDSGIYLKWDSDIYLYNYISWLRREITLLVINWPASSEIMPSDTLKMRRFRRPGYAQSITRAFTRHLNIL